MSRRLPGIRFDAEPPALGEALPRMDIAFFAGFAASGPIDLAVAVETLAEFEAVFGPETLLAHDPALGERVRGLLHSTVRAFFAHGGMRCWVTRVAGESASINSFPLAGLLRAERSGASAAWRFEPARIAARSPGSWSDGLTAATRLGLAPLAATRVPGAADGAPLAVDLAGAAAPSVRVGDLLRVRLDGGSVAYGAVASLDAAPDAAVAGTPRRRATLHGLCVLRPAGAAAPPLSVAALGVFVADAGATGGPERTVAAEAEAVPDAAGRIAVRCRLPAAWLPRAGSVVALHADRSGGDAPAWLAVDEATLLAADDAGGGAALRLRGRATRIGAPSPGELDAAFLPGTPRPVQLVRLGLRARQPGASDFTLDGLCMASGARGGLGAFELPDDARYFAAADATAGPARAAAPAVLAVRDALGRLVSRFPFAAVAATAATASTLSAGQAMLVPLAADMLDFGDGLPSFPTAIATLQRDGLADFSWTLFGEPLLAAERCDGVADAAAALRLAGRSPRPLRGLHGVFGGAAVAVVDEPTLLAVPDAVQPGWQPAADAQSGWTELPAAPEALPDRAATDPVFLDCARAPLAAPRFVRGADADASGSFSLRWTEPEAGCAYELVESADAGFLVASVAYAGFAAHAAVLGKPAGVLYYRVRASLGPRLSGWARTVAVRIGATGHVTRPWHDADLLAVHRLMLRAAAGRGDLLAVLGLPRHYDTTAAVAHADALRGGVQDAAGAGAWPPPPIGIDESRALSHGALHHPWLATRRVDDVVAGPPDGAVCGQLAAVALARGAWIAVANRPLHDVVALGGIGGTAADDDAQRLLDAQVNRLRAAPHGFVVATAETLSPDPDWRPINVRRLMSLLRRVALRRGATYVFEPNGDVLQRTVERGFGALLDELFRRGAFAGASAQAAYRVEVEGEGGAAATARDRDDGRFRVDLKVAPSLPLTFLTVRLARRGERLVAQEVR